MAAYFTITQAEPFFSFHMALKRCVAICVESSDDCAGGLYVLTKEKAERILHEGSDGESYTMLGIIGVRFYPNKQHFGVCFSREEHDLAKSIDQTKLASLKQLLQADFNMIVGNIDLFETLLCELQDQVDIFSGE